MPKLTNIRERPRSCEHLPNYIHGAQVVLNRNQARLRWLLRQRPVNVTAVRKQRRWVQSGQRWLEHLRQLQYCCTHQIATSWKRLPPDYLPRIAVHPHGCHIFLLSNQQKTHRAFAMRGLGNAIASFVGRVLSV